MSDGFEAAERLYLTLAKAEDKLARLDEQLRQSPLAAGWIARMDFYDAAAWAWADGKLAPLEDLVLHDAHMDVRSPTQDLTLAHGVVRARRKAWSGGAELLSVGGAFWLAARVSAPPDPERHGETRSVEDDPRGVLGAAVAVLAGVQRGASDDVQANLAEWLELPGRLAPQTPELLIAAVSLEAWRIIAPLPNNAYVGPILAAVRLRARKRFASGLLPWHLAARERPVGGRLAEAPLADRLTHHLESLARCADLGLSELQRLSLARLRLSKAIGARRAQSRAPALAELLLASPLVSAPLAASRLRISQQAVRALVPQLGPTVREVSGRRRYQAWQV